MAFLQERSTVTGLPVDRMGLSCRIFSFIYPTIAPPWFRCAKPHRAKMQLNPGGFVMDSQPGLYDSVLVLDYKSLYPSIIRTFLIDPAGMIEGLAHQTLNILFPVSPSLVFSHNPLFTRYCQPYLARTG